MGRRGKEYIPSDAHRELIERMAAVGVSRDQICEIVDLSLDTILKHYKKELETAAIRANARMAGALYQNGLKGNVAAQIFWMKTRANWKEVQYTETTIKGVISDQPMSQEEWNERYAAGDPVVAESRSTESLN